MASKGKTMTSMVVRMLKILSVSDKIAAMYDQERAVYMCAMYVVPIYIMHYISTVNGDVCKIWKGKNPSGNLDWPYPQLVQLMWGLLYSKSPLNWIFNSPNPEGGMKQNNLWLKLGLYTNAVQDAS